MVFLSFLEIKKWRTVKINQILSYFAIFLTTLIKMNIIFDISVNYNCQMIHNYIWYIYVPAPVKGLKRKTNNSNYI